MPSIKTTPYCAFCGKPQEDTQLLFAGGCHQLHSPYNVYICIDCVNTAFESFSGYGNSVSLIDLVKKQAFSEYWAGG
jgi:hypothetical protein